MNRKQRIKELENFLRENYPNTQLFNSPCIAGDYQKCVYLDEADDEESDIWVMYAPHWDYCDIYGLTDKEFDTFVSGDKLRRGN